MAQSSSPASNLAFGVLIDEGNPTVDLLKTVVPSTYPSDVNAGIGAFGGMAQPPSPSSYLASGVSIDEGNHAVELMKTMVQSTYTSDVIAGIGAFGGMVALSQVKNMQAPVLVASTDGVGTKTMIAQRLNRWNSVGADLVNHSINDILVQGATPLLFMDYVASAKLEAAKVALIVQGMALACKVANCVLLGGETAEMPGVYRPDHWDIAGTIVGLVDRAQIIDGSAIAAGDQILALASTGLHTNGYSLARHALADLDWQTPIAQLLMEAKNDRTHALYGFDATDYQTPPDAATLNASLGDLLLAVHRSYLPEIQTLRAANITIHGLVHITGGGFTDNIPRVLPQQLAVNLSEKALRPPLIFSLIQHAGKIAKHEMQRVFNLGAGMLIFTSPPNAERIKQKLGEQVCHLGEVIPCQSQAVNWID